MSIKNPWFVTSFPKAGSHLVDQLFAPLTMLLADNYRLAANWLPGFVYAGWGPELRKWEDDLPEKSMEYFFARLEENGGHGQGHVPATQEILDRTLNKGWGVILVTRDLRDIVVSEAYHLANPKVEWLHPRKTEFARLSHRDRLWGILAGNDFYPSIVERWEHYRGWLGEDRVYKVPFELLITDPLEGCRKMLNYLTRRTNIVFSSVLAHAMVENIAPGRSQTYRKGKAGQWMEEFDDEMKDYAEEHLRPLLEEMGYRKMELDKEES